MTQPIQLSFNSTRHKMDNPMWWEGQNPFLIQKKLKNDQEIENFKIYIYI